MRWGQVGMWGSVLMGGFMLGAAVSRARVTAAVAASVCTGSLM